MAGDLPAPARLPLLALGFASLLAGLAAGVVRFGWTLPLPADLIGLHGPLMVSGFFGTVIGLERAVALGRRWAYLGPAASGAGGLALLGGAAVPVGAGLITLGSLLLTAGSVLVWRRQRAVFTATLVAGAAAWAVGNGLWLAGQPLAAAIPWWSGFLVLTIAGERLELSRFRPAPAAAKAWFAAIAGALLLVLAWGSLGTGGGWALPLLLLALVGWLARFDIALYTVRGQGLPRFTAVCLLSGYAWLAVGAGIGLWSGGMFTGRGYDATLHSLFLGFVFAMVFGHAPIIFPAVTRLAIPYHPLFYLHLAALHASLALRVAGDLALEPAWRSAGGLLNALTLLLFIANTAAAVVRGRVAARRKVRRPPPAAPGPG